MKLSEQEAGAIKAETGLEPLPPEAPAQPDLEAHFGEHTFYVAEQGLFIFEPEAEEKADGEAADSARAVQLAVWTEQDGKKALAVIEPTPTDLVASLKAA